MNNAAPITLADVTPEWVEERREIIARDGYAVRAGLVTADLTGAPFTIEIKSLRTNAWLLLLLPNGTTLGATAFTTAADRDAVLARLQVPTPTTKEKA